MATECEDHRTISLMAHSVELLLQIDLAGIRNKLDSEIAKEFGFWKTSWTRESIFTFRTVYERCNRTCTCFIDYENT